MKLILGAVMVLTVTFSPGCAVPPPSVMAPLGAVAAGATTYLVKHFIFDELPLLVLKGAGREAAELGLQALPANQRVLAASALILACKMGRSYVDGTPISSAQMNVWLTNEFGTLSPELLKFIADAAAQLDYYVPISETFMPAQYVGYVDAFLDGLSDGAETIIANPPMNALSVKVKYTKPENVRKTREKVVLSSSEHWLELSSVELPKGELIERKP